MQVAGYVRVSSRSQARTQTIDQQRPWCTDQRDGRTDPNPCLASRDADGLRAPELQHPVQDMDADGGLGRPTAVGARAERVPDYPFVAGDR